MADSKMATSPKRKVLITGCSDGSLGSALAIRLHKAGLHVYATARNPAKLKDVTALGIETLTLDVLSASSIADAVNKLSDDGLDILVNNAGALHSMPIADLDIPAAKATFDLNVWSYIAVTQAFLPLLLRSPAAMVVNHTSSASTVTIPFQSVYNASKAAMAMFSDSLRLELEPFGIAVVDIKSVSVATEPIKAKIVDASWRPTLPKTSIYLPARELVEQAMSSEKYFEGAGTAAQWADAVVKELLRKSPPKVVWTGGLATWAFRTMLLFPVGTLDGMIRKLTGLDVAGKILRRT